MGGSLSKIRRDFAPGDAQAVVDQVKDAVEAARGGALEKLEVHSFATQVVAGARAFSDPHLSVIRAITSSRAHCAQARSTR